MRYVLSSTVRSFTHAGCSFGTLHLRGLFVPKGSGLELSAAHSWEEQPMKAEEEAEASEGSPESPAPAAGAAEAVQEVDPRDVDPSSMALRCIDFGQSIPDELHVFVEFDLPPHTTVLKKSTAEELTRLAVSVLDDLEDLQQDGGNAGVNIVGCHIGAFVAGLRRADGGDAEADAEAEAEGGAEGGGGVLVYAAASLLQESRFARARQQEAAVRFRLNTDLHITLGGAIAGTGSEPDADAGRGSAATAAKNTSTPGARALSGHTFAISHPAGHLCTAFVGRAGVGAALQPGDSLALRLCFRAAQQPCVAVRVELVKKVLRALNGSDIRGVGGEGVVVRRDVVSSGTRSTADALELNMRLALPAEDAPSAGMRGLALESSASAAASGQQQQQKQQQQRYRRYWLEFTFRLPSAAEASSSSSSSSSSSEKSARPPFSWGVPIDVQLLPDSDGGGDSLQARAASLCQQLFVAAD